MEIIDVIIEFVAAVGHTDTVALLVVEEAQCLAVGRLGENLRAVEQVLGRICAVTLAGSDAFRIVSKGNCFILYRFCKLPALPCHAPATVSGGIAYLVIDYAFTIVCGEFISPCGVAIGVIDGRCSAAIFIIDGLGLNVAA